MPKKDYIILGMTIASTAVRLSPYATLGDMIDVIDSWSTVLTEDNPRFNKEKFSKWVIDRWLIESK